MKVFVPKRVLYYANVYDSIKHAYQQACIPLEGEWEEKDDYFRQVTSGRTINDVLHAKVVDANGCDYNVGDLEDDRGYIYPRSIFNQTTGLWLHAVGYETQKMQVWREPKNYKGKHPKYRLVDETVRVTRSALINVSPGTQGSGSSANWSPNIRIWQEIHPSNPRPGYRYAGVTQFWIRKSAADGAAYISTTYEEPYFHNVCSIVEGTYNRKWKKLPLKEQLPYYVALAEAIEANLYSYALTGRKSTQADRAGSPRSIVGYSTDTIDHPQKAFLLDEVEIYGNRLDPILLGKDLKFHNYWRNWLTEHALLAACESFPRLNDNSISNIIEIVGFIKALVIDHRIEIPNSLSSAWLAYRYQYSTTRMDVEEAIKFVHRHMDLGSLDRTISCYGVSYNTIEGVDVTCRCSLDITPKNLDYLGRIWRALDQYGLTPDFYVIWDMIPYSFIVDWFIPVGDILGTLDADAMYLSGEFYKLENLCYSLSYTRELVQDDNSVVKVKCYTRWKGSVPRNLNSFYWLDAPSPQSRTVAYRVLDTASLFIGR